MRISKSKTSRMLIMALVLSLLALPSEAVAQIPFSDVSSSDWYHEYITYVYEEGLMQGTSDTIFEPYSTLTRAMVATVLYRMEGEPNTSYLGVFDDVANGLWYSIPVCWAYQYEIVNGTSAATFEPNAEITREQLVTMMYRYAGYKGYRYTHTGSFEGFTDDREVSSWAEVAMVWAVTAEIIRGTSSTTLEPRSATNRAQFAAISMRFIQKINPIDMPYGPDNLRLIFNTRNEFYQSVIDAKQAYEKGHGKTQQNLEDIEWYFDFKESFSDTKLDEIVVTQLYVAIYYLDKEEINSGYLTIVLYRLDDSDPYDFTELRRTNDTIDIVVNDTKVMKQEVYYDNIHIVNQYFWVENGYAVQMNIPPWLLKRYPAETFFNFQEVSIPVVSK